MGLLLTQTHKAQVVWVSKSWDTEVHTS